MLAALVLQPTDDTPKVVLDCALPQFEISGKSLPEDVNGFYQQLIDWFKAYQQAPKEETVIVIGLEYFNTATSRPLIRIFSLLDQLFQAGHAVKIIWQFLEEDEDIRDTGIELAHLFNMPFEEEMIIEED